MTTCVGSRIEHIPRPGYPSIAEFREISVELIWADEDHDLPRLQAPFQHLLLQAILCPLNVDFNSELGEEIVHFDPLPHQLDPLPNEL